MEPDGTTTLQLLHERKPLEIQLADHLQWCRKSDEPLTWKQLQELQRIFDKMIADGVAHVVALPWQNDDLMELVDGKVRDFDEKFEEGSI